jgi:CMD domain protein
MSVHADIIDHLVGIVPGSALDRIRRRRTQTRDNAQASYDALFSLEAPEEVSAVERFAVAAFVAGLTGSQAAAGFYLSEAVRLDPAVGEAVRREIACGQADGPYGAYPAGPLTPEDRTGPAYQPDARASEALGPRLAAVLRHAHLVVLHPRDANPFALQALLDASWTTPAIVTLSQIIAFVSFQARVVAGLTALNSVTADAAIESATHV